MKHPFFLALIAFLFLACSKANVIQRISSAGALAESVYLTRDHNGNPVLAWTEKQAETLTLFYSVSNDQGESFSGETRIPLTSDVSTHSESMPKVAFKKDGTVIAAYEKKAPTKENKYAGAIYYIMSGDNGKSWSPEKFMHSATVVGLSRSYFDIERLPDGEIGASWLDIKLANTSGGRSVRFAKTTSAGGFGNAILIDSSACQCCRIDVYTDESQNVFVAYRGLKKGPMGRQIRDMMISTSTDLGETFSTPLLISADNWFIDGCPHTGPSLCGNKGGLFSLWYTEGTGTGIYYAHQSDGANGFGPRQLVSNSGRHPQLCTNGDRIAMLWEENLTEKEKENTVIHYRVVRDGVEVERKALTSGSHNAFLPVVTATRDGFLTAFLMESESGVGVYFVRL
jgi:hypothetical protein